MKSKKSIVILFILVLVSFLCSSCFQPIDNNSDRDKIDEDPAPPEPSDKPFPIGGIGQTETLTPTFRWIKAKGATSYRIVVSNAPDIESGTNLIDADVWTTEYPSPVIFENTKTYWWQVKAYNNYVPGKWSGIVSFTVTLDQNDPGYVPGPEDLLPAPYPIAPEGTILSINPVVFSWDEVKGADHYELSVINPDDSIAFGPAEVTGTSYEIHRLSGGARCRVRIITNCMW
jgi:hypothetical protein